MEPPPLVVVSGFPNPFFSGSSGPGAGVLALVYGVVILANAPKDYIESKRASKEYQGMLAGKEIWNPAVILANNAVEILESRGEYKVKLRAGYRGIPSIKNREQTFFMENWYEPIRAWFNANPSLPHYGKSDEKVPDAIIEVGILNYEIYGENIFLQVMIKMVDPRTGLVLGRVKKFGMLEVGRTSDLFMNNARGFKDEFNRLGFRLLNECLKEISFIH